jgi:hypothetical protein
MRSLTQGVITYLFNIAISLRPKLRILSLCRRIVSPRTVLRSTTVIFCLKVCKRLPLSMRLAHS